MTPPNIDVSVYWTTRSRYYQSSPSKDYYPQVNLTCRTDKPVSVAVEDVVTIAQSSTPSAIGCYDLVSQSSWCISSVADMVSPWMTPLRTGNTPDFTTLPSGAVTVVNDDVEKYTVRKITHNLLEAPSAIRSSSRNLWLTESKAAVWVCNRPYPGQKGPRAYQKISHQMEGIPRHLHREAIRDFEMANGRYVSDWPFRCEICDLSFRTARHQNPLHKGTQQKGKTTKRKNNKYLMDV